jgi:hypothetical protein
MWFMSYLSVAVVEVKIPQALLVGVVVVKLQQDIAMSMEMSQ